MQVIEQNYIRGGLHVLDCNVDPKKAGGEMSFEEVVTSFKQW